MLDGTSLISVCPHATVVWNADFCIVEWNSAASELFGWQAEEATGKKASELFIPPELTGLFEIALTDAGQDLQNSQDHRRITILTKNHIRRPVEFWLRRLAHSDESLIVGFFREQPDNGDTESRATRLNLESRLFDHSGDTGVSDESVESALQGALDTFCEVTGWPIGHAMVPSDSTDGFVSSGIWSVLDPDDSREFIDERQHTHFTVESDFVGRALTSEEPSWRQLSDDRSGGLDKLPEGIVSQCCLPVRVGSDTIAVLEFFSRRSKAPAWGVERLIRRLSRILGHVIERRNWQIERQRMAAIVESSPDGIISKDVAGIITSWNAGAEKLYGYSASEAIGQSTDLILPPRLTEEEPEIQKAVREGRRLEQFETIRRRSNGDLVNVSLTVSPLRNSEGQIIGSAFIERNITRRKQRELQLQEAIASAEQANVAKTEFLANISHELRTPMNAIIGMTELSLQESISDVVRDYLETAKDSAHTMLFLINDILDFSRLEAGRFELDPVPFDIRHLLDETMRTLSLRAHEKGLELAASVHPDVPLCVVGDPLRIKQVLTNLIGNAVKFTERGEVVVAVEVEESPSDAPPKDWISGDPVLLRFTVNDTGIGISKEDRERIFAPFTQADATTTRSYAGTGLGLSICVELSRLMNGELTVDSEVGKGSSFSFTADLKVAPAAGDQDSPESTSIPELKNRNVLIVDDNETTQQILTEMFRSWDLEPVPVSSAEQAIDELARAQTRDASFALMLVDAVMPKKDGLTLIQEAEQRAISAEANILMLSPADQHLFRSRSAQLPISAFLEKPVSQSNLLNALSEATGRNLAVRNPEKPKQQRSAQPLRILIADDIAANQKVVEAILQKRGHHVTIAHNGREAIERYQREEFDVILMDVQMPIMDGIQATQAIREIEAATQRRVPIIAMTAHAMRGDREACLNAGMDAYVAKPINAVKLLEKIEVLAAPGYAARRQTRRKSQPEPEQKEITTSDVASETAADSPTVEGSAKITIWNPQVALARMGNDPELMASMIDYFNTDIPELMEKFTQAVDADNSYEATRLAHSIKGLCSNFEAPAAVETAQTIENHCRSCDLTAANKLYSQLETRVEALRHELDTWTANS